MDATNQNHEQAALWNGVAGRAWVEAQATLDRMLQPFEEMITETLSARSAIRVLDVGCGTGSTTLAVARRLGAKGRVVGLDISEPMIETARARAKQEGLPARFVRADAQVHGFEPARFDRIISRFGVMFFDDPARAFANLRRAARRGAELRFVAWRSPEENPFLTTAERAAAPLLPTLPAFRPEAPGPFAFADRRRVHAVLEGGGWAEIEVRPVDVACRFPEEHLVLYLTRLGPVGRILQEVDERSRAQVVEAVRAAFEPFVHGTDVRFDAAAWLVAARGGSAGG